MGDGTFSLAFTGNNSPHIDNDLVMFQIQDDYPNATIVGRVVYKFRIYKAWTVTKKFSFVAFILKADIAVYSKYPFPHFLVNKNIASAGTVVNHFGISVAAIGSGTAQHPYAHYYYYNSQI